MDEKHASMIIEELEVVRASHKMDFPKIRNIPPEEKLRRSIIEEIFGHELIETVISSINIKDTMTSYVQG